MNTEIRASLGIELGSTRIKAVLIDDQRRTVATGVYSWENQLREGYWTYALEDVWKGLGEVVAESLSGQPAAASVKVEAKSLSGQPAAASVRVEAKSLSGCPAAVPVIIEAKSLSGCPAAAPVIIEALGISAMMHGYLVFDKEDRLLVPFRTWRNTTTEPAAGELTALFGYNIPQRWSVAHLYQAILNGEPHVKDIAYITTLSGYVHWQLTGEKVLGVGDASGMFPITGGQYDSVMVEKFKTLTGIDWNEIAPQIRKAGEPAGSLKAAWHGIAAGVPLCPPEGDAGTGMVATDSVRERTGNVSAGTSIFAMVVLDKPLKNLHTEIDLVTTPDGKPVAMAHCNNCTSDIDAWVRLFGELSPLSRPKLYDLFYEKALAGEVSGGGLLSYNYFSGEPVTGLDAGRPLLVRKPDAAFNLANFCRCILYSAVATLKIGMDILAAEEVRLDKLCGHGGLFKSPAGQKIMADALETPVSLLASAGEGGAWGIAVLADYLRHSETPLAEYLAGIFTEATSVCEPEEAAAAGFREYLASYREGLAIEKAAVKNF